MESQALSFYTNFWIVRSHDYIVLYLSCRQRNSEVVEDCYIKTWLVKLFKIQIVSLTLWLVDQHNAAQQRGEGDSE